MDKLPEVDYQGMKDYIENFSFGSTYLHKLCNKVKKNNDLDEETFNQEINSLLNSF